MKGLVRLAGDAKDHHPIAGQVYPITAEQINIDQVTLTTMASMGLN